MYVQILENLVEAFGRDFIEYVLGLDLDVEFSDLAFTAQQGEVVQQLRSLIEGISLDQLKAADPTYLLNRFSGFEPTTESSILNYFRHYAGAEIPATEASGDLFLDTMVAMALDTFPLVLVRPDTSFPVPRQASILMSINLHQNPKMTTAVSALLADPSLSTLFDVTPPKTSGDASSGFPGVDEVSYVILSSGSGGTLQLSMLLQQTLASAATRCLMAGQRVEWETFSRNVEAAVRDLRALANRRTVPMPALIGLAGVTMPPGSVLELPGGRLRPVVESDKTLFMGNTSMTAVYETHFDLAIYAVLPNEFDDEDPVAPHRKYDERSMANHRDFARSIDLMRLGLLLASPPDNPWSVREVSRFILDGLFSSGVQSWDPNGSSVPVNNLDVSSFDSVRSWSQVVAKKHVPSLNIGMRRVLSSTTARTDPIDGFVDAVICWESLFGAQTETVFRVTGAIAKLVEPSDPAAREELQRELKKVYGARSRLVHGGEEPKQSDLEKYRRRAIAIATECLRRLYGERSDLLELPTELRGARVLLE
jgi:hypothetical protein